MSKNLRQKFCFKSQLRLCKKPKIDSNYECSPYLEKPEAVAVSDVPAQDQTNADVDPTGVLFASSNASTSNAYSNIDYSASFDSNQFIFATESTNLYENGPSSMPNVKPQAKRRPELVTSDLYVCCIDYDARIEGDLTLRFTDRVKLIHANKEFALVKNVLTNTCGWVPRNCIQAIAEFLENIKFY